jgi:predicted dehydrogenase
MSNSARGVAVVGLGIAGSEHLREFARHPEARVVAVCDVRADLARSKIVELDLDCPTYTEYDACLADPNVEAVVIATPNDYHCEQIVKAAHAGKAILVEKPAALSEEELDRIAETLRETSAPCHVNMILRWHPLFEQALWRVRNGDLGDIYYIEAEMLYGELEIPEPSWERTVAGGRNIQIAVGCHAYDQVLRFANRPPEAVYGVSTRRKETWEYDPVSTVLIRFSDGLFARVTTVLEAQMAYQFNLRVFGTKGTIINGSICLPGEWGPEFRPLAEGGVDVEYLPFDRSVDSFLGALRGRAEGAPFTSARATFDLAIAADAACNTGSELTLRPG